MGPEDRTRRDIAVPSTWRGLSECDREVLAAWLGRPGGGCTELHTDVCVGHISDELRAAAGEIPERQLEAMYALRIDALVLWNGRRLVVECKAWANAHALGQVLTYRHLLRRCGGAWAGASCCVVSRGIDDGLRGVYREFGVEAVQVGGVVG